MQYYLEIFAPEYYLEIFCSRGQKQNKSKSDIKSLKILIIDIKWLNSLWYICRNDKVYEIQSLSQKLIRLIKGRIKGLYD